MLYRLMGSAHGRASGLWSSAVATAAREHGQGTVEYVALILLVGVVLAGVVVASKKANLGGGDIAKAIVDKLKDAMESVK
jgi:hypothetical protein